MMRRRLDAELVRRGLAATTAEAREAVLAGLVSVAGAPASKPAALVGSGEALAVAAAKRPFVSRAGSKLAAALDRFGVSPDGLRCLDAGASTGGFTDCLLQAGAAEVIAIDVGYGQLDWGLRNDPRVTVIEKTNVRDLTPGMLAYRPELVVADLSFISLRVVLPTLTEVAAPDAGFVVLVKPQFEAERGEVGSGGVVRDPAVWLRVLRDIAGAARGSGLRREGVMASPITGPAGNVEFLMHLTRGPADDSEDGDIHAAVAEGDDLTR